MSSGRDMLARVLVTPPTISRSAVRPAFVARVAPLLILLGCREGNTPRQPTGVDASNGEDAPVDGTPSVNDGLAVGAPCDPTMVPGGGCGSGLLCCQPCCNGRPASCTEPVWNSAGIGVGRCPLPDLTVNAEALARDVGFAAMTFAADTCEVRERCVAASGRRLTLHFTVSTSNLGTSDLVLGDPRTLSGFTYSDCHRHFHRDGYTSYELLDVSGAKVIVASKRSFCLMDSAPVRSFPLAGPTGGYTCEFQGIARGWSDSYDNGFDCQFMDVTDLPPGSYRLRVTVNPDRQFAELSYENNTAEVTVNIPGPNSDVRDACSGRVYGPERECGWQVGLSRSCTPGTTVVVGCGEECGLGKREGNPMIRVCSGGGACPAPGLGINDDCALAKAGASVTFTCPPEGSFTAMTGPAFSSENATCELEIRAIP